MTFGAIAENIIERYSKKLGIRPQKVDRRSGDIAFIFAYGGFGNAKKLGKALLCPVFAFAQVFKICSEVKHSIASNFLF